jgi:hypothetical protein
MDTNNKKLMVDIIIPLKHRPNLLNLYYSLSSIKTYCSNYDKIILVLQRDPLNKGNNVAKRDLDNIIKKYDNIKVIYNDITEPINKYHIPKYIAQNILEGMWASDKHTFFVTNDDIIFTDFVDCSNYPFYYVGINPHDLLNKYSIRNYYFYNLVSTLKFLSEDTNDMNLQLFFHYYDIHTPILYDKAIFTSMYKNIFNTETTCMPLIKTTYMSILQYSDIYKVINKARQEYDNKIVVKELLEYITKYKINVTSANNFIHLPHIKQFKCFSISEEGLDDSEVSNWFYKGFLENILNIR